MGKVSDIAGRRFGRLVVIERRGSIERPRLGPLALWAVRCDCGAETAATGVALRKGAKQSCGCLERENQTRGNVRHGHAGARRGLSPEYQSWRGMVDRCTDPLHRGWAHYGGRGITVCERWLTFEGFFADMGPRPPGTTLDRYPDNDGPYAPGNCRWATASEQQRNTRVNRMLTFRGETRCMVEWSEILGIHIVTIANRLARWGSVDRALGTPVRQVRRATPAPSAQRRGHRPRA